MQLSHYFEDCASVLEFAVKEGGIIISNDNMLKLYSYYKQATIGDCNIPKPSGILNLKEKSKWTAWNNLKGTTSDSAKSEYVKTAIDIDLFSV